MQRLAGIFFLTGALLFAGCESRDRKASGADKDKYSGPLFEDHIRATPARTPEEERLGFKVPEGFEVSLYASEPDIGKPINISFDARGRMWVTQSFEYPFPATPGKGKDRLTILEDSDGDGKADKFTHFNDSLNIPIGVMPMNDGAIVYSIPNVYRFTDANHDGKADGQKKLLGPFQYTDTHGMVNNFILGYDGWIHACHGYTNRSRVAGADGDSIYMISGNTFRFRRDGSRVEHMTYGRINPFGLAYDERGYLYSTDCHTSPLYQLIRGGDYTQWGKEEDMGFAPDMKPLENEATALAGIAYYADDRYPEPYRSNFYIGDAVSSRVYRNSFVFQGSSPVGKKEEDFVLSEDPWFRPVDVKLGPDGALYIADFYNSIIGHYEVALDHPKRDRIRGRIWRITYKGNANALNDWTTASVDRLIAALTMENLAVRLAVTDQLAERIGQPAIDPLKTLLNKADLSIKEHVHALWVLQRLNALDNERITRSAAHTDPTVRLHTLRILLEQEGNEALQRKIAIERLQDPDPHVQRAAVELLSKFKDMETIERLIAARKKTPSFDSHMAYTIRLGLRNALRSGKLMQEAAARQWSKEDAEVLSTVLAGVQVPESGLFLFNYVKNQDIPDEALPNAFLHIMRFIPSSMIGEAINTAMTKSQKNISLEYQTFRALQQGLDRKGEKETIQMQEWGKKLAAALIAKYKDGRIPDSVKTWDDLQEFIKEPIYGVGLAGQYKLASQEPVITGWLKDTAVFIDIRGAALKSLLNINIRKNLEAAREAFNDSASDDAFRKMVLSIVSEFPSAQVSPMMSSLKNAGPDLQQIIVMSLAGSEEGKTILFDKVRKGEIFPRTLIQPKIEERIMMNISSRQKAEFKALTANLETIDKERQGLIVERISDFNNTRSVPSPVTGRTIFVRTCAPCHSVGGEGGSIGPQLDGVGKWGVTALTEKILDPNRNISETFRSYTLRLKDGRVLSGLFRRDEGEASIYANAAGEEFAIVRKDILEKTASRFTLMPDQFGSTLAPEDFNALMSYLLTLKNE